MLTLSGCLLRCGCKFGNPNPLLADIVISISDSEVSKFSTILCSRILVEIGSAIGPPVTAYSCRLTRAHPKIWSNLILAQQGLSIRLMAWLAKANSTFRFSFLTEYKQHFLHLSITSFSTVCYQSQRMDWTSSS